MKGIQKVIRKFTVSAVAAVFALGVGWLPVAVLAVGCRDR